VGQAREPGMYVVSSLTTLINAVFQTGGPTKKGSLRRIELRRGGKTVTNLDLYSFLSKGDTSADSDLLAGDVIYISPVGQLVAIDGSVNLPGIYETGSNTTVAELLGLAGGLTP